ncbi:hypothetical protein H8E07_06940 [bacterium]|nr:hypothetical protein [bacterium]
MIRGTTCLLLLLGVALLAGCSDGTGPQPDDTIRGQIVDTQGDPVTDARIVLQYEVPVAAKTGKPTTPIHFELPESGPVTAWISSYCDGDTLRMLIDGETPAGVHDIHWDFLDDDQRLLPDGVYRFHLVTESGEVMSAFPLYHLGYGGLAADASLTPHAVVDDQGRFSLDQACLAFGFTYDSTDESGEPAGSVTIGRRVRVWAFSEADDAVVGSRLVTVDPRTGIEVNLTLGR